MHHNVKSRYGNLEGGLFCQDCHSTTASQGNGNITGTLLANVEIECSKCHGTAGSYSWELPLGWGTNFKGSERRKQRVLPINPLMNRPPIIPCRLTQGEWVSFIGLWKSVEKCDTKRGPGDRSFASGLDFEVPKGFGKKTYPKLKF